MTLWAVIIFGTMFLVAVILGYGMGYVSGQNSARAELSGTMFGLIEKRVDALIGGINAAASGENKTTH